MVDLELGQPARQPCVAKPETEHDGAQRLTYELLVVLERLAVIVQLLAVRCRRQAQPKSRGGVEHPREGGGTRSMAFVDHEHELAIRPVSHLGESLCSGVKYADQDRLMTEIVLTSGPEQPDLTCGHIGA